jgi:hypothetical protein
MVAWFQVDIERSTLRGLNAAIALSGSDRKHFSMGLSGSRMKPFPD